MLFADREVSAYKDISELLNSIHFLKVLLGGILGCDLFPKKKKKKKSR